MWLPVQWSQISTHWMVLSYNLSARILLLIRYLIRRSGSTSYTAARGCVCLARWHASVHCIRRSFTLCRQRSLCSSLTRHAELTQHNPRRLLLLLLLCRRKLLDSGLITGHGNLDWLPKCYWFSVPVTHHPMQCARDWVYMACSIDPVINNAEL